MFAVAVITLDAAVAVATAAIKWIKWGVKRAESGLEDVGRAS